MKQATYPIKGMHCASCEILISEELASLPDVLNAQVSLKTKTATVYARHLPPRQVVRRAVEAAGYEIGFDGQSPIMNHNKRVYKDLVIGLVAVGVLALLYTKLGLSDATNIKTGGASVGLVGLMMGLTAGFSTCMALIGGLVLGMSSKHAEKHPTASPMQKFRPHLFFNLGRIVSFIVLGGVIGALGAAFSLKGSVLGLLTLAVGLVMFTLGLQLTELFPRLKGRLTLPSSIAKRLGVQDRAAREYSHKDAMMLGAITFFLPCGFTQAMQLFAVSTGSAVSGAIIMGMFAIGTAPGLLSIGGLTSVVKGVFAQRFFRIVGVAVMAMALINFSNAYNLLGVGRIFERTAPAPVATSLERGPTPKSAVQQPQATAPTPEPKEVTLTTTFKLDSDITPSNFTTKVGKKTTLIVDVKEDGEGCMSTIMIPGLDNNPQFLKGGKKIKLSFTPKRAGTYTITCAMGVPRGKLTVQA
ncbi:hypothetical protein BH09PAT4_BH09PAT4_00120 [soil metagenome]